VISEGDRLRRYVELKARDLSPAKSLFAAIAASSHPLYKQRCQRTKRRLGRQRGAKVAQIELARKLTEAIWHMLTRNQPFKPFAPAGAIFALTAWQSSLSCATGASPDHT
jgi:hypothetical protein